MKNAGTKPPFISVCIPTFNRLELLKKLLVTVRREIRGFEDETEVCISDNGSGDGTRQYLEKNWKKMPFVTRLNFNQTNQGVDRNLLKLVDIARGEYIWYMGDDDEFLKGAFARVRNRLRKDGPDMLYVPYVGIKDGRTVSMEEGGDHFSRDLVMQPHTFINSMVMRRNLFSRIDRELVEMGLDTIHVHSWTIRLNELYHPGMKLVIMKEPAILNGGSNLSPPLSWELIVHSKCFIKTYANLLRLPGIGLKYQVLFLREFLKSVARAFFFILCERTFRTPQERLGYGFFRKEFGALGFFLYPYRQFLRIVPQGLLSFGLRGGMNLLRKTGLVKKNNYDLLREFWSPQIRTSTERWNEFLHVQKK